MDAQTNPAAFNSSGAECRHHRLFTLNCELHLHLNLCVLKADLQIAHRLRCNAVFPFHIRLARPMHGHLEFAEETSQYEIQFRVRQAVSEPSAVALNREYLTASEEQNALG